MIADLKPYPAMKNSGVPWLGEVPEHWNMERAKWLFRKMDRPVRDADEVVTCFRDGTVTLRKNRRVRGFTESLKELGYQGIRRGDLVIHAMDAFAGAIGVADADGKGTPVYSVCEPTSTANAQFYAYTVREMARSQWIQALAKGIRERSTDFRFEGFGSQAVPLPPLPEQAAIVQFLDHEDRRIRRYIRAKQKLIKLLEEQKQAIIHRVVTRGLDPNVRLKPSGVEWLGDVPEHWEVRTLGQLAGSFRTGPFGSILHQSEYVEGGTPIVNPTHMRDGRVVAESKCSVPPSVAQRLSNYALEVDDVVFSRRGELGRCALVRDHESGWICGTGSMRVRINYVDLEPEYLIRVLQVRWVGEYLSLFSVGATMESLNTGILKGVPVLLPPVAEQRKIVEATARMTEVLRQAADDAQREITLLREYRTRLIADVVTGKLDVREAAAGLPDEAEEPEPLDEAEALANAEDAMADDLDTELQEAEA